MKPPHAIGAANGLNDVNVRIEKLRSFAATGGLATDVRNTRVETARPHSSLRIEPAASRIQIKRERLEPHRRRQAVGKPVAFGEIATERLLCPAAVESAATRKGIHPAMRKTRQAPQ